MLGKGIFNRFWAAAVYRIIADVLQATAPLVMRYNAERPSPSVAPFQTHSNKVLCPLRRELIDFLDNSYYRRSSSSSPNIGKGIGLAFGLFAMQLVSTICTSQFFYHGASSGVLFRAGLMKALYDRALTLSPVARAGIPNAKLYAHTIDISRIDFACNFFVACFSAPLQVRMMSCIPNRPCFNRAHSEPLAMIAVLLHTDSALFSAPHRQSTILCLAWIRCLSAHFRAAPWTFFPRARQHAQS